MTDPREQIQAPGEGINESPSQDRVALANAYYWRDVARRERDDAEREVRVLQERIRKALELADAARALPVTLCGCANSTSRHDPASAVSIAVVGWTIDPQEIRAILSGSDTATNTEEREEPNADRE